MRLIQARSLKFHDFNESDLPEYAILSHTWDPGKEVTLQDMSSPYLPTKNGYVKVTETCRLALHCGIEFVWVDTCCIDKSSSAELSESINSMFRWYQKAKVCFVHLDDLSPETQIQGGLPKCRWFTRGWTLQELLAPISVQFYDREWNHRGSRNDFAVDISRITGIPDIAIRDSVSVKAFSTAQKMAWASQRVTTRVEDMAYCLLGLFDVNMPLIYGEGLKAFRRLQEEIIRQGVDLSLFAWQPDSFHLQWPYCSLLASSPSAFRECHDIHPFANETISAYAITNKGLQISTYLLRVPVAKDGPDVDQVSRYVLRLGQRRSGTTIYDIGIYLKKIGPGLLVRETNPVLGKFLESDRQSHRSTRTHTFCILATTRLPDLSMDVQTRLLPAFYMAIYDHIKIKTESEVPAGSWDHRTRICLRPPSSKTIVAYSFIASTRGTKLDFGVLFDFRGQSRGGPPRCLVIDKRTFEARLLFLILQRNSIESMEWRNVRDEFPEITKLTDHLRIDNNGRTFDVVVSINKRTVELESHPTEYPVLEIEIKDIPPSTVSNSAWVDRPPVTPVTPMTPITPGWQLEAQDPPPTLYDG
jgi:hypothetical protein